MGIMRLIAMKKFNELTALVITLRQMSEGIQTVQTAELEMDSEDTLH